MRRDRGVGVAVLAAITVLVSVVCSASASAAVTAGTTSISTSPSKVAFSSLGGPVGAVANQDDPTAITFDEFELGSTITDEYASRGVVFTSDVFTSTDISNPTAPVLSGSPRFFGDIVGHFTVPGTTVPTTVNGFSLDVGFIDDRNSVEIDYYDAAGALVGSTRAQSFGINEIDVPYRGVASFKVSAVEFEAAGFAIDNLVIHSGVQGIHPTRMAEFGDSYSSGEGLLPEKGLEYDCGTDLHKDQYVKGTTALALFRFWSKNDCQTATGAKDRPKDFYTRGSATYENLCHRDGRAYPNQIRSDLGIAAQSSIFVACSGATTANVGARGVSIPRYPDSPPGVHGGKSQLETVTEFAKGGPPDLITIGIGGNDANFAGIVKQCIFHTCTDPDFASRVVSTINGSMYSNVRSTFTGLRTAFPAATIVAFGYPSVVDDPSQTCAGAFRIGSDELSWLKYTVLPTINDAIKDAATEAGVVYVDITAATVGHGVCSPEPWINGVRLGDDNWVVGNESFHPSQKAHDAIASLFMNHYTDGSGNLLIRNPKPSGPIRPATGPEIRLGDLQAGAVSKCGADCLAPAPCIQSCPIHIQGSGFDPGAAMGVTLESEPVLLGLITADPNGQVSATFKPPGQLEPGLHTVTLEGAAATGTRESAVQPFWVYGRMHAKLATKLGRAPAGAVVRSLSVRKAPPGTRIDIVCARGGGRVASNALVGLKVHRGGGCPFAHRHFRLSNPKGGKTAKRKTLARNFAGLFKAPLAPRTILRIVASQPELAGRSLDVQVRGGGRAKLSRDCTDPGGLLPTGC